MLDSLEFQLLVQKNLSIPGADVFSPSEGLSDSEACKAGGGLVPVVGGGPSPERGSSSLDRYVPQCTADIDGTVDFSAKGCSPTEGCSPNSVIKRKKRAFQRIMSGLFLGGNLKLITLTSSPDSDPKRLQRNIVDLVRRIRRKFGKFEYVRVRVRDEGYGVVHLIARGSYIPQKWLSEAWNNLHGAKIVHIERIFRTPQRVGNYLIVQYVSNQPGSTWLAWSWGWVYRGFSKVWFLYKKKFGVCAVDLWKSHLRAFRQSLHEWSIKPPPQNYGLPAEMYPYF